jgi:bacillolysin
MKNTFFLAIILAIALQGFAQQGGKDPIVTTSATGIIRSVEFPHGVDSKAVPSTGTQFFSDILGVKPTDEFRLESQQAKRNGSAHERFTQWYHGVRVDGAGYNFHYQDGRIFFAHGNYVRIESLNPTPTISSEQARDAFAKYQKIPQEEVIDYRWELLVKEISQTHGRDTLYTPKLVYRIYLNSNHPNNTLVGFVDAHTAEVLETLPILIGYSDEGTFHTRYSGTQMGITQHYNGVYNLSDSTRGAVIHTWNLLNTTDIANRVELTDNDNIWTTAEHRPSNNDMGQDVHWALQQIYDFFYSNYDISSFDNDYHRIDAHIRWNSGQASDNAGWHLIEHVLLFGEGYDLFSPVASVDAVGHEYGHAITQFQIGWEYSSVGNGAIFHEGMSDIGALC